jgi:hypothetical protein
MHWPMKCTHNRTKETEDSNHSVSLKCPACGHEFSINEAVLAGLRSDITNEVQADMRRRECELQAKALANKEKETSLAKKSTELEQRVELMVNSRLQTELEELRKKEAKKASAAQEVVVKELENELREKAGALKRAQEQELALRREKRQLEEQKESLTLQVQRTLDE